MHDYVGRLQQFFMPHKSNEKAIPMQAYMRDQFPFLGIPSPERKRLTKEFVLQNGLPPMTELNEIIFLLWDLPQREFQYIALALLDKLLKQMTLEHIPMLEELVIRKSWWDTVDGLAPQVIGKLLNGVPEATLKWNQHWIESANIWLQRTAIIFQLKYKEKTNTDLLFSNILRRKESKEFFVQKAMGWALREYSKTCPADVERFVKEHETDIPSLTKREGLKVIMRS